jgi:hypothetical protein
MLACVPKALPLRLFNQHILSDLAIARTTQRTMSSSVSPSLASAVLTNVDTEAKVTGATLWKDRPIVVVVFRRPGCGAPRVGFKA